jgi:hypothetical protein
MTALRHHSQSKKGCLLGVLFSISTLLPAQSYEFPKAESGLFIKELDPRELNSDAWALNPRLQISAPDRFTLQSEHVSIADLPQKLFELALLCPPNRRYVLLQLDSDVPSSTLILFLQSLQRSNALLAKGTTPDSGIPITAIIPIDRSTHQPAFPIQPPKPTVKPCPPPPPAP